MTLFAPIDGSPVPATTRIRLDLSYDGTDFAGWARQPAFRTVQGDIEDGLASIMLRYPPSPTLFVAGRTDAGVHAQAQVAHFDLSPAQADSLVRVQRGTGQRPPVTLGTAVLRRLGGILVTKPDIVLKAAAIAPPGFDARFSALWRTYEYRISDLAAVRDPQQRLRTTWHPATLDLAAMDDAAATLVGLRDFAAYCKPKPGATTIRELQDFRWRRDPDGVLVASITADAFCHSMVRALVGATVAVGEGRLSGTRLANLRMDRTRITEFKVMQAHGLTLMQVGYPEDAEMRLRAVETRNRRSLPVLVGDDGE
ncbi:MAG: tRNA pseudouridine synthase A [Cryobacterium sp.]